jgi:hypothetical protein
MKSKRLSDFYGVHKFAFRKRNFRRPLAAAVSGSLRRAAATH